MISFKYISTYKSKFTPSPELLARCKAHLSKNTTNPIKNEKSLLLYTDFALIGLTILIFVMLIVNTIRCS